MSAFASEAEAVTWVFRSLRKLRGLKRLPDELGRDPLPTRQLLQTLGLPAVAREYAVVTGSKGKGSTTAMTARLLQTPGRRVGMLTSPHLVSWRERVRVDGRSIPETDFLRILGWLAPAADRIEAQLGPREVFSPTGLFLALALRWFDEQEVTAAVLEVGRGGRFDDVALVPNALSLITPVVREHDYWLGPGLARIAWHKAGIIKARSRAISLPQAAPVVEELSAGGGAAGRAVRPAHKRAAGTTGRHDGAGTAPLPAILAAASACRCAGATRPPTPRWRCRPPWT